MKRLCELLTLVWLADIHNTTKINAVVANGAYLSRNSLDKLLGQLAAAVKEGK
jgi:hypothetical protein